MAILHMHINFGVKMEYVYERQYVNSLISFVCTHEWFVVVHGSLQTPVYVCLSLYMDVHP